MPTKVHMEALSPTMEEGQLVRWLKKEGDAIKEGDVLAEIETDKATMELVARGSGVLQSVSLGEGQTAPVGQVIAVIGEGGGASGGDSAGAETAKSAPQQAAAAQDSGDVGPTEKPKEIVHQQRTAAVQPAAGQGAQEAPQREAPPQREAQQPAASDDNGNREGRLKASPLARRLAEEQGVELRGVSGTGPGGRITKRDIEAAAQGGAQQAAAAPQGEPVEATEAEVQPAVARAPVVAESDAEEVPLTQMRKTIAKRLAQSIGPIPTFYLTIECDMTRMMELRERVNVMLEKDKQKASINDFIIKAVAMALARHPEVNASWTDSAIVRHHRVHVGVAVAVEDGLITPIVRDADRKRVRDIGVEVRELAGRAREKKLKPEEYTGATFSISNLGMFGIVEFTAIINPPESGILAVGAVEEKPVTENGEVVVRPRMRMTMSCDHRVIDGATGARFLQTLRELIEDPLTMIA
jgi:pyruvate dehydrogenase E2 component (dihydrolipoamide acetyltransferase)